MQNAETLEQLRQTFNKQRIDFGNLLRRAERLEQQLMLAQEILLPNKFWSNGDGLNPIVGLLKVKQDEIEFMNLIKSGFTTFQDIIDVLVDTEFQNGTLLKVNHPRLQPPKFSVDEGYVLYAIKFNGIIELHNENYDTSD